MSTPQVKLDLSPRLSRVRLRGPVVALAGLILIAVSAAVLFGLLFRDRSLTHLQQRGTIRIGYAVEAPYAFLKLGGAVTGESPEVARAIVAQLGIPHVEWRQVEFGSLISGLEAGRYDVIATGLFITPERARRVNFSEPTFHVQQALLVAQGNPRDLHSYEQALALPNVKLAVVIGAVEEALLSQIGLPDRQLLHVPDALAGRTAVESGVADGLALSSPTVYWMALQEQLGKTAPAYPFVQPDLARRQRLGFGAFAFRQRDRQLQAAWNAALRTFIGSPEHQQLVAPFGFTAAELPGPVTTQEVLTAP